jgi:methyl-accepting chemotaxis protein
MLRRFSTDAPIAVRLAAALVLPIAAMAGLALLVASEQWRVAGRMQRLDELGNYTTRVGDLVHELQKERGMSAVFINTGGKQMASELAQQRQATSKQLAAARTAAADLKLDAYPGEVRQAIVAGLDTVTPLDARRAEISAGKLAAAESYQYFTRTIAELLAITREAVKSSDEPAVTASLLGYSAYMAAKERAGQERATGAAAFASGKFSPAQHRAYVTIVADQNASFDAFDAFATPEQRDFARKTVSGATAEEVVRLRKIAVETAPGAALEGVTGSAWFAATTARIDLMKVVEDRLAGDLGRLAHAAGTGARQHVTVVVAAAVAALLVSVVLAALLARGILRPVGGMTRAMRQLATGDLSTEIPAGDHKDELGQMAGALQVFRDNMAEAERMRAEQEASKAQATAERRQAMLALADRFEAGVGGLVNGVTSAATELEATAQVMASGAEQTTRQSTAVAAASEQATQNVQTVATATEELSSSIHEIAQQVNHSSGMIGAAVGQAEQSNVQVQGLTQAAQKIGDVVKLINDIAGQTNLLALNATIEAARAGDAGKGFAVVASEVKALANQTAQATEEIAAQVRAIQEASHASAQSIRGIAETVSKVHEVAATIAAAVEEQGAATQEIARNVQQAAKGTQEVSSNIAGVSQAATQAGAASAQVLASAGELSRNGESLKQQVDAFLREVRAA